MFTQTLFIFVPYVRQMFNYLVNSTFVRKNVVDLAVWHISKIHSDVHCYVDQVIFVCQDA